MCHPPGFAAIPAGALKPGGKMTGAFHLVRPVTLQAMAFGAAAAAKASNAPVRVIVLIVFCMEFSCVK